MKAHGNGVMSEANEKWEDRVCSLSVGAACESGFACGLQGCPVQVRGSLSKH